MGRLRTCDANLRSTERVITPVGGGVEDASGGEELRVECLCLATTDPMGVWEDEPLLSPAVESTAVSSNEDEPMAAVAAMAFSAAILVIAHNDILPHVFDMRQ